MPVRWRFCTGLLIGIFDIMYVLALHKNGARRQPLEQSQSPPPPATTAIPIYIQVAIIHSLHNPLLAD